MWIFILMWCAIIASVPVHHTSLEAFALPSTIKILPDIFWNTSNPIFRIDNTDHIIDVNQEDSVSPFVYDQINIICPFYDQTLVPNQKDTEQFVIYHVTKEEYDTCMIHTGHPKTIAQCNNPYTRVIQTISFRSFNPMPYALEYLPGKDYYFISTSSKEDLRLRIGGMCHTNNMKLVFKVGKRHQAKSKTLSDSTNSGSANSGESSVKEQRRMGSSKGDEIDSPDNDGLLPNGINRKKVRGNNGRRNRSRKNNRERKNKVKRKGDRRKNNGKDKNINQENNNVWPLSDSCPPTGCSPNIIENHEGIDYSKDNMISQNNYNRNDYSTGNKQNRRGEMPSKEEKWSNDKPGIIQQERSNVAIVQDLMREEASKSAFSSATKSSSLFMCKSCRSPISQLIYISFILLITFLPLTTSLHFLQW